MRVSNQAGGILFVLKKKGVSSPTVSGDSHWVCWAMMTLIALMILREVAYHEQELVKLVRYPNDGITAGNAWGM